jgi:hypothetical protein
MRIAKRAGTKKATVDGKYWSIAANSIKPRTG